MLAAMLIAAALAQVQDTQPSIAGTSNLPNPNYARSSVHVQAQTNRIITVDDEVATLLS